MYEFLKKFHVWKKKKKKNFMCVCVCPNVPEAANALFVSHDYGSIFYTSIFNIFGFHFSRPLSYFSQIIKQLSQHLVLKLHPIPPISHSLASILHILCKDHNHISP